MNIKYYADINGRLRSHVRLKIIRWEQLHGRMTFDSGRPVFHPMRGLVLHWIDPLIIGLNESPVQRPTFPPKTFTESVFFQHHRLI